MTRHYGHIIGMRQTPQPGTPQPHSFVWRGQTYRIRAVWSSWHLRDRWWADGEAGEAGMPPASDRRYYRVLCTNGLQCDLYHDAASDTWVLDRVHD